MNVNKKILMKKSRFEGKLILTSLHKKLICLSSKGKNNEVLIFIDTRTTNSFMSPIWAKRLELAQEPIKEIRVSFIQSEKTTNLVVKDEKFKCGNKRF